MLLLSLFINMILVVSCLIYPFEISDVSLSVDQELHSGSTHYDIGISLLEFPIANGASQRIGGSFKVNKDWTVFGHFSRFNSKNQNQKFIDSDFLVANDPSTLYIQSESDNDLDYSQFNIGLNYRLYSYTNSDIHIGVGLKQQQFSYQVYNVHQWEVNRPNSDIFHNNGNALTYDRYRNYSIHFLRCQHKD